MRTLIQRQLTDDGPYVVGMSVVAAICLLVLAVLSFVYPHSLELPVTLILLTLPAIIGLTLFAFGVLQTCRDRDHQITTLLSVFASPRQIVLGRLSAGVVSTLAVVSVLALGVGGAILGGLVQWPPSLIPSGLVDIFTAWLEIGLASYLLGSAVARSARSAAVALCAAPLTLIPVSLIIVKGFGRPLAMVLVPFILILLVHLYISALHRSEPSITVGLAVLIFFVIPLYWLRYASEVMTARAWTETAKEVSCPCYSDFPFENAHEMGVGPFTVCARVDRYSFPENGGGYHFILQPLGILSYLRGKEPDGSPIDLSHFGDRWGLCFDREAGLYACCHAKVLYAGPDGVAGTPLHSLGAFESRVLCWQGHLGNAILVFNDSDRCFYSIDFDAGTVQRRVHLADSAFHPADIVTSKTAENVLRVGTGYPRSRGDAPYAITGGRVHVAIVDESGAVGVLGLEKETFFAEAGRLPRPYTFFGRAPAKVRDCLDYEVQAIAKKSDGSYAGLICVTLSRQGTSLALAVFDERGRLVRENTTFYNEPSTPPALVSKFLIEVLHPPLLTLASFFTAYRFDAAATHRAIFLMPNSIVALQRDRETSLLYQFLWALLFLVPALLFAGFLGRRVWKDAALVGLPRHWRWLWLLATVLFGLPAYIAYRLARPKVALVRCRPCGNLRRPDMERCHQCGAGWKVPELDAPTWRIIGSAD